MLSTQHQTDAPPHCWTVRRRGLLISKSNKLSYKLKKGPIEKSWPYTSLYGKKKWFQQIKSSCEIAFQQSEILRSNSSVLSDLNIKANQNELAFGSRFDVRSLSKFKSGYCFLVFLSFNFQSFHLQKTNSVYNKVSLELWHCWLSKTAFPWTMISRSWLKTMQWRWHLIQRGAALYLTDLPWMSSATRERQTERERPALCSSLGPEAEGCSMGYSPRVGLRGLFQFTSFVERLHQTSDGQLLLMSIKMISSQVPVNW